MIKFGTGGFRGIIADDFNKNNVKLIAQAVSNIYQKNGYKTPIYIGYDFRFMSNNASEWISEVLAGNNIKVVLSDGPTTTPEVMYACKLHSTDFGFMITSSHNPAIYNGVKVFQKDGMDAEVSLTREIEDTVNTISEYKSIDLEDGLSNGTIVKSNLLDEYINNISNFITPKVNNLKVLVDPIYGTGSITLSRLMNLMKIKNAHFIHDTQDTMFGGLVPNPTRLNMMKDAEIVRKDGYDLAIGTDSDCDRLGILDEQGQYVDANEIMGALYYYLVKYRGLQGDIIKNIATSNLIDEVAHYLGYECHEVDVGFKNISQGIKDFDALIGGESSGGLTIRGYIFGKDSTFSTALFLEMVATLNKPVSEIIKEVRDFAHFYNCTVEDEMRFKSKEYLIEALQTMDIHFTKELDKKIQLNSNFKYYFKDGSWALIRFSGTEPVIRIFVESENEEVGKKNIEIIKTFVSMIDSKKNNSNELLSSYRNTVLNIYNHIKNLDSKEISNLPENTYILPDDKIVCFERKYGESRFPYGHDGFYLWASSSGYITANESRYYYILSSGEGREPYLNFYAGIKNKDGNYNVISLLGAARFSNEIEVKRFVVYSKAAVYYLTFVQEILFSVRFYVNDNKEIVTSAIAISLSNKEKDIYISSYQNYLFKYEAGESIETKWFKKCSYQDNTFIFESPEDIDRLTHIENWGLVKRIVSSNAIVYNTTSKADYKSGKNVPLNASKSLVEGKFELNRDITHFTDTAIAGDIIQIKLQNDFRVDYITSSTHKYEDLKIKERVSIKEIDDYISLKETYYLNRKNDAKMISFNFGEFKNEYIDSKSFNKFLDQVIYQVEYCALAKNSGSIFLGVRDVVQQIEALIMWNPQAAKTKLLEVLSFIDPSGRPPRQYSIPPVGEKEAKMDLRPFIDQPVWIISTIYTYLSYTNDYDFLKEECTYFEINSSTSAKMVDYKNTVLEHMIALMRYLETKIDYKYTNCLRTIYGDWNDALDGLGKSIDGSEEYGFGVSVMASLQYYQNLYEMIDILKHLNTREDLVKKYQLIREKLEEGLLKNAIVSNGRENKIVHGWGDQMSYFVGSFDDVDHESRDSLTSNAFFILSGMIQKRPELKHDILNALHRLDSKYGLKTFNPHFKQDCKGVGRIVNLPKGTAENGATYIHATLFGIDALYSVGEGEFANEQLKKILPLTHDFLSTTPFVMSNSYVYNEEENMDGESMNDWYTGSATVLLKMLVHSVFGVKPDLNGLTIIPSNYLMTQSATLRILVKGYTITINYQPTSSKTRTFYVDGELKETLYDSLRNTNYISLDNDEIHSDLVIDIK